jgi:bifunctional DNA-binding transcriptional regulator/antitoxin component of YhaV-PrlF toxin-antitoxin module
VTIPKAIAERYGIEPGGEIEWLPAGEAIRVVPRADTDRTDPERRLALFDRATERQHERQARRPRRAQPSERGWSRDDLYARGRTG